MISPRYIRTMRPILESNPDRVFKIRAADMLSIFEELERVRRVNAQLRRKAKGVRV